MFEVGFWEMVLIGIVGLLVFGPEKLPRVARETALWIRKARSVVSSVKHEIDHELQVQELRESLNKQRQALGSLTLDKLAASVPVDERPIDPPGRSEAAATPAAPMDEAPRDD